MLYAINNVGLYVTECGVIEMLEKIHKIVIRFIQQ